MARHPLSPLRALRLWIAWGVAVLSLVLLSRSLRPLPALAELEGFAEAAAYLKERAGPGSFVLVWPPEQAAALAALPPELTAADALPIEQAAARRYPEILVVGPAGFATPPELDGVPGRRLRFAEVEVAAHSHATRSRSVFDLRTSIGRAEVKLVGAEALLCSTSRPEGGWSCPGRSEWSYVGPTVLQVEGRDYPCVWAHPATGEQLVIALPPQQLADELVLSAALSDAAAAMPNGAPVELLLEVEGVGSRRLVRSNAVGVARVSLPTAGAVAAIRLVITTVRDGRRHLGINLEAIEQRQGGTP